MPKPFDAEQQSLEELMLGNRAYAIPLYQRRYVWGNEENLKLWEDVVDCYENRCNHFLGSLVTMQYEKDEYDQKYQADELVDKSYDVFHVVDGQQRLTSLSLILSALYQDMLDHDVFFSELPDCDKQDKQDWDDLKSDMRGCLVTKVRDRNSKSGKGYIPRVVPIRAIYENYKMIVNSGDHGRQLRIDKAFIGHIANVSNYRKAALPSTDPDAQDARKDSATEVYDFYYSMFKAIGTRMKIIRIECGADEDAFQVFESLNGTGLRLTASDRIKNILMGRASKDKNPLPISKIESKWSSVEQYTSGNKGGSSDTEGFFSAYLFTICGKRVPRKSLAKTFANDYLSRFTSVSKALGDLEHAADLYGTILNPEASYKGGDETAKTLKPGLRRLLVDVTRSNPQQAVVPLLCAAMHLPGGIEDPLFENVARRLLVLLVRHKVCQLSTNMLDRYFESFCKYFDAGDVKRAIDSLRDNTKDDPAFHRAFAGMTFDAKSRSDFARARYYLQEIEDYLRALDGNDALHPDEEYTLEHVIPQDYDPETWFAGHPDELAKFEDEEGYRDRFEEAVVQSIGNMCLLRRPENASAGNSVFDVKLVRYCKSDEQGKTARDTFKLVGQIVYNRMVVDGNAYSIVEDGETFCPSSVERRAQALADYALRVWTR